ncbi:MAG: alpha/beta hydrolase [Paraperlucidibaca sp.]|jgi:pimeloyl-ACP methyl ester carboxylesterase|uniref:alpha/beta hydrolase n=1 Tax=Paraperlucidibaca sp. TaxID=2708021 RepID=UPI001B4841DC|nr:alpha/beta hydrolase [Paraperlucidibaca sp.]MBQ0722019.1 alpha/beta hydrolase [Paraperlucidibaca sp.]MBQ0841349.1 alpha/beta hydrolase [Paraperlucidibaca sp.]|tara:strand:- start:1657 stop:2559 length:903 start_codon:yes stop_codon:yes gene_type:complete
MNIRRGVAEANGLELAYEDMGDVLHPPIILVMGLSAQLTLWPLGFCEGLVAEGHRVIRFDNRDIGLSSKLSDLKVKGPVWKRMVRAQLGLSSPVPYTIMDMADDVLGLLDFLQIRRAHIVGASMGGMITQIFAAKYPDRVRSVGIIFSSTNQALLPPPKPSALKLLTSGPGKGATSEQYIAHSAKFMRAIHSPNYPFSDAELLEMARASHARSFYPAGVLRQYNAILGTGSLRSYAKRITKPTVVIHGDADPLVRPACGRAVARAVPRSQWLLVKGMGHDLPPGVWPVITQALITNMMRS